MSTTEREEKIQIMHATVIAQVLDKAVQNVMLLKVGDQWKQAILDPLEKARAAADSVAKGSPGSPMFSMYYFEREMIDEKQSE